MGGIQARHGDRHPQGVPVREVHGEDCLDSHDTSDGGVMAATARSQAQRTLKNATKTVSKPTAESTEWMDNLIKRATAAKVPATTAAPKSETVNWLDYRVKAPASSAEPVSEPTRSARGYTLRAPTSAPSTGGGGVTFDRTATARIILLAGGINAVAVVIRNRSKKPVKVEAGSHTITVPASMQSYAGTVVLVTIALIVNELNPGLGAVMALGIVLLAFTNTDIMAILGGAIAPGVKVVPNIQTPGGVVQGADGSQFYTGPTGSRLIPVPGLPGQYSIEPLPSHKPNA